MKATKAFVGARGTDSVQGIDPIHAKALKASGIDFCNRYLGSVSKTEVADILAAGLAFMPVTFANRFDGKAAVTQLQALGLPVGVTVWLDVEGPSLMTTPVPELIAKINGWATELKTAGLRAWAIRWVAATADV